MCVWKNKILCCKTIDTDSYLTSWVQLREGSTVKEKAYDLVFSKELASPLSKNEAKWLAQELDMASQALLKPPYYFEISRLRMENEREKL